MTPKVPSSLNILRFYLDLGWRDLEKKRDLLCGFSEYYSERGGGGRRGKAGTSGAGTLLKTDSRSFTTSSKRGSPRPENYTLASILLNPRDRPDLAEEAGVGVHCTHRPLG